ncbi:MAG: GNAT family N-acetyltransferase, partial [Pseudomonadota bacterium]
MNSRRIRSERLLLRPFQHDDVADLFRVFSNPDAMRYWGNVHASPADTARFIAMTLGAPETQCCDFIIELDGAAVGKVGMWKAPEIGFILHPDHHRKGYMREALKTVIPHLFQTYDLARLTADVDPDNRASLALLARLGFRRTGWAANTDQIGGRMCHSVYLALERADWP